MIFSRTARREKAAAARIYAAVLEAARQPEFYRGCGVPDTLQGRFEMVALALFPVLHRLTHDPGDDPALAGRIAESFVEDMDDALRAVGVSDTKVPKRMKTLYSSFAGRMKAYGEALGGGEEALRAAILRNVFPDGGEDAHAAVLSSHLQRSVAAVKAVDISRLRAGETALPRLRLAEVQA
jgi:cytochrome b pre-mRNA-processing protein 3